MFSSVSLELYRHFGCSLNNIWPLYTSVTSSLYSYVEVFATGMKTESSDQAQVLLLGATNKLS